MQILRIHEAVQHPKPIITYDRTWVWRDLTPYVLVGWDTFSDETVVNVRTNEVLAIKGQYTPEQIWDKMSLALLEHDIVCEPLQPSSNLELPHQIGIGP